MDRDLGRRRRRGSSDLYRQLIDGNDLVKELDDIEAISQQISQHAEVLYQNWKTSQDNTSTVPTPLLRSRSTDSSLRSSISSSSSSGSNSSSNSSLMARNLTSDPETFAHREPTVSSSSPLELLASPEVNGSLKDLVSSFVSTDRAKQAARQTISSTINSLTRKNTLGSVASPPLRSPNMLSSATPRTSLITNSTEFPSQHYVHTKMPTIFSAPPAGGTRSVVPIPIQHEQDSKPKQGVAGAKFLFEQDNSEDTIVLGKVKPRLALNRKPSPPPHPELTPQQKQHIFERSSFPSASSSSSSLSLLQQQLQQLHQPIRRFRSSGSVAERVMIFEKCPVFGDSRNIKDVEKKEGKKWTPLTVTTSSTSTPTKSPYKQQASTKSVREVPIHFSTTSNTKSSDSIPRKTLSKKPLNQNSSNKDTKLQIPKFHFPFGNPESRNASIDAVIKKFGEEFRKFGGSVNAQELGVVLENCGMCVYWKGAVFLACGGGGGNEKITLNRFSEFWRRMLAANHDEASQFVRILTAGTGRKYLVPEDFVPLIQDVVDTHPGLGFLKEATEFHSRYVHTVIARIFFCVNRSWSGRISITELRRSNFLTTLKRLKDEEDINQITDYFSYEHFYVIYCKFWELDKDHDLFIDREDLSRHNDQAISTRMIDRIFSGTVTRGVAQKEGKMSYTEFVWFLLAEEDKRSPTSIEYWFRCMDLDGDGFLSMYELEYFYEEQLTRMEQLGIETLPFEDCLCQMLDMIMPKERNRISLKDLKACRMTPIFFDTFFNLEKYLDHEQRDPFASQREVDEDGNEVSDWDRFAAEEYELLVAEEGNGERMEDLCYDDDDEGGGREEIDPEMHLNEALDNEPMYQEPLVANG